MKLKTLFSNKAFKIALIYLILGGLWILVSDSIVNSLFSDTSYLADIQTYKGWFYVVFTGFLLFYLIFNELDKYNKIASELKQSQELFKTVVENAEEWIWEVDSDGIFTFSSPSVEKLLGYKSEELVGKVKLFDLFHPNEREFLEERAKLLVKNKEAFKKFQHRKLHKNGKDVWILTSAIPINDENMNFIGYRGADFNISDRIEKEIKLKESEERHRNLSDLTFEGILIHKDGVILDFNSVYQKMIGYEREDIIGKNVLDFFIAPEYRELVQHNVENNYTFPYQFDGIRKNGERLRYEVIARNIDYNGEKARVAALRDITWRLESEKKLKESEERYRNLAELTFEGLVIHDGGRIIDFNSTFQRMSEYSRSELLGRNFFDMIPKEYHDLVKSNVKKDYVPPYEFEALTKSGKRIWFEVTSRSTEYDGNPARVTALRDITWRIDAENKLKESEERYRGIFNAYSSGLIIFNPQKQIIMANPAACKMFGFDEEELIKLSIDDISTTPPPEINFDDIDFSYEDFVPIEFDAVDKKKDGTTFDSRVIIKPFLYNQKPHVIAIVSDITEKKLAEEELNKYRNRLEILVDERTRELEAVNRLLEKEINKQKEAEKKVKIALKKEKELSELKSGFLSMASHEFRTPLTSILSSADLLDMGGRSWDEERYMKHINKIRNSVKNMTTLLNDVLTISRTQDGKIKLHKVNVNLQEFTEEIINEIKVLAFFQHNIESNIKISEKIIIDPKLLRQCIENLLVNAIKYSKPDSTVKFTIESENKNLIITIEDNGPGIEEEELVKIFEPFYRLKSASKISGSGLGLAIVKKAVETLEGEIFVYSNIGVGTKFKIILPLTLS